MAKNYKIEYLPSFYNDLEKIVEYIAYELKNVYAANNLVDEIELVINRRVLNPQSFEIYKSTKKRKDIYYRIYVKNYTIFYIVKDDTMEVRRILHSKRNIEEYI